MKNLNASKFIELIGAVRQLKTYIDTTFNDDGLKEPLIPSIRPNIENQFNEVQLATGFVGAELTLAAAQRMWSRLKDQSNTVTVQDVRNAIEDIESRLYDELSVMSFVVLDRSQVSMFTPANDLAQWDIVRIFPEAARELEEAAKCLALKRPTAGVFHAMRMLEVGINRFAQQLKLPEPERPAQKNWGTLLKGIKDAIDEKYVSRDRMKPDSDASKIDRIYASLDAVKNPWRNNTMHVEGFYSDMEALHILRCVTVFMQNLASLIEPTEAIPADDQVLSGQSS